MSFHTRTREVVPSWCLEWPLQTVIGLLVRVLLFSFNSDMRKGNKIHIIEEVIHALQRMHEMTTESRYIRTGATLRDKLRARVECDLPTPGLLNWYRSSKTGDRVAEQVGVETHVSLNCSFDHN